MDAISFLKQDHREVEQLFARFEKASERAGKLKRKLVDQMIVALSKHAAIEEALLYPAARVALQDLDQDDLVLESLEEHHLVKWILEELMGMAPDAERFDAKVTVLMENVRHHVKEEEKELFPKLKKLMAKEQLQALGDALMQAKKAAPTKPHPRSPDSPPGNLIMTPIASAMDHATELVKGAIAKRRGKKEPQPKTLQ